MLLGIQQHIPVQHVYIQMMAALCSVAVKQINKVIDLCVVCCHNEVPPYILYDMI